MPHLLLVGQDLNTLVDLSVSLSDTFQTTTIAVASDVLERAAWSAQRQPCQMLVCLEARAPLSEAQRETLRLMTGASPTVIFLVPQGSMQLRRQLQAEGAIVVERDEAPAVIAATFAAFETRLDRTFGRSKPRP